MFFFTLLLSSDKAAARAVCMLTSVASLLVLLHWDEEIGYLHNHNFFLKSQQLEESWAVVELTTLSPRLNLPRIWQKYYMVQTSGALLVSEHPFQTQLIIICSLSQLSVFPRELWHLVQWRAKIIMPLITLFFFLMTGNRNITVVVYGLDQQHTMNLFDVHRKCGSASFKSIQVKKKNKDRTSEKI